MYKKGGYAKGSGLYIELIIPATSSFTSINQRANVIIIEWFMTVRAGLRLACRGRGAVAVNIYYPCPCHMSALRRFAKLPKGLEGGDPTHPEGGRPLWSCRQSACGAPSPVSSDNTSYLKEYVEEAETVPSAVLLRLE